MAQALKSNISAEERAALFREQYGNEGDVGITLAEIVTAAGNYLATIVGKDDVDIGMTQIVKRVVEISGGTLDDPHEWRQALTNADWFCFSEWALGRHLHDLTAYAIYGIVLDGSLSQEERERNLKEAITVADEFLQKTPALQWGILPDSDLHRVVRLAINRWALDHNEPVEPAALAEFGGVSEGHIRNMMSTQKSALTSEDGRVPAQKALEWLVGRPEYWNSVWREQVLPQYGAKNRQALQQAVFIPEARDESRFHPGLKRGAGYTIGEKGAETQIADFDTALAELQKMPIPHWRRPNKVGNWGIVSGVRWVRVDVSELENLAKNLERGPPGGERA